MTVAGEGQWTAEEVAARAGISPELAKRFWRALGFPDVMPEEEPAFTDADVEALRIAASSIDQGVSPEV